MIKTRAIEGIVPVVSTPLTENEEVDVQGLKRLIDFLINKDIGGLWVLGTGSEDMNLSFRKRLQVAQTACEANDGKKPLVLGSGFFAMEDILEFMGESKGLKCDAYHVMPYHPLLGLERIEWFYKRIADKASKPLWMYTSANWCRPIPPEFVEKLKDYPNIAGIKFSTRNTVDMFKVIKMASDGFQVITAVASQLYPCLCMNSKAHTSSLGSCIPDVMIKIYNLFQKALFEQARDEQYRLNSFLARFPSRPKKHNFLQAAEEKFILFLKGICSEYTSSYYTDLEEEEKESIKSLLREYNYI